MLGIWLIALLSVTTLRLLTRAGGLAYTFFRVTVGCTLAAAVLSTVMVFAESGDAWQLLAVVSILAILGYLLTPITQRLAPTEA